MNKVLPWLLAILVGFIITGSTFFILAVTKSYSIIGGAGSFTEYGHPVKYYVKHRSTFGSAPDFKPSTSGSFYISKFLGDVLIWSAASIVVLAVVKSVRRTR